jgi:hypothetical protein
MQGAGAFLGAKARENTMPENGAREPNGHEENGHQGNGQHPDPRVVAEYNELGAIGILSFVASPPQVAPFERTTLSWRVNIPPALRDVSLTVAGQTTPGPVGSAIDNPYFTTTYSLDAETPIINRQIGTLTVRVDDSACKTDALPATNFADDIKDQITQAFGKSSDFANVKVTVTPGDNIVVISVQYGGTDITVQLGIGIQGVPPQATAAVWLDSIDIEVQASLKQNVFTFGQAASIAKGIIKPFVGLIVQALVIPGIEEKLNGVILSIAPVDKEFDPQKRTFVLTDLTLTGVSLMPKLCPLPVAPPQHVPAPPIDGQVGDER